MVSIDGTEISDLTIDGDAVSEVTMDGDVVWVAGPTLIEGFNYDSIDGTIYDQDTDYYGTVTSNDYTNTGGSLRRYDAGSHKRITTTNYDVPIDRIYTCWINVSGGGHAELLIGDSNGVYRCLVHTNDNELALGKGSVTDSSRINDTITSTNVSLSSSTWYELTLYYRSSGNLELELYDTNNSLIASLSATDTSYLNGGVLGFHSYHESYWDAVYENTL